MRHHPRLLRSGFTMIELLIVIMIIAILMSLLVSAAFSFIVNAREAATATTISKVDGLLQERIRSFRQYEFSDAGIRLRDAWNTSHSPPVVAAPGDAVLTPELAEVLLRKQRFRQAFPQSYADADRTRLFPSILPAGWTSLPITFTSPATGYLAKYESGIVLYAFLARGETFGAPSAGDDAFTGSEVRIGPETNNLPCLVDAWGEPLRFYRWPTRLIRCGEQSFNGGSYDNFNQNGSPDPAGGITASGTSLSIGAAIRPYSLFPAPTPASLLISNLPPYDRASSYAVGPDGAPGVVGVDDDNDGTVDNLGEKGWPESDDPEPLNTDPDDPTFRLTTWFNDGNPYNGNIVTPSIAARRNGFVTEAHDFYTFHTPLIVSAGPDKLLGLYEPTDTTNFGYLAAPLPAASPLTYADSTMRYLSDNITNLNRRTGGK